MNMETRVPSWVCRTKSDVLSLQLDQSVTFNFVQGFILILLSCLIITHASLL